VRGFDTGPANALMDAWCQRHVGAAFDADGASPPRGRWMRACSGALAGRPMVRLPPPKSTGREQFHLDWVDAHLHGHERVEDVQATLLELTAVTVADALLARRLPPRACWSAAAACATRC
jgi:anhydro-N-acetylmuramic acid kinase